MYDHLIGKGGRSLRYILRNLFVHLDDPNTEALPAFCCFKAAARFSRASTRCCNPQFTRL